jgi:hypothetical protein
MTPQTRQQLVPSSPPFPCFRAWCSEIRCLSAGPRRLLFFGTACISDAFVVRGSAYESFLGSQLPFLWGGVARFGRIRTSCLSERCQSQSCAIIAYNYLVHFSSSHQAFRRGFAANPRCRRSRSASLSKLIHDSVLLLQDLRYPSLEKGSPRKTDVSL